MRQWADSSSGLTFLFESLVRGYSSPLPPGAYRVTLTCVEAWLDETKPRREFDILLEGELERYRPLDRGFGVFEDLEFDVETRDGVLNIDFRRREDDPEVCAVAIKAL